MDFLSVAFGDAAAVLWRIVRLLREGATVFDAEQFFAEKIIWEADFAGGGIGADVAVFDAVHVERL